MPTTGEGTKTKIQKSKTGSSSPHNELQNSIVTKATGTRLQWMVTKSRKTCNKQMGTPKSVVPSLKLEVLWKFVEVGV
jgi:hypothetical protein